MPDERSNVSASIAPSAAPAETPSVNGVASGLRSSACNTTPDAASDDPTSAPASTRGSRATKKICASVLSANGTDESKTRRRLIDVEPTSGARRHTMTAAAPKSSQVDRDPARDAHARGDSCARAERNHRELSGSRVRGDIDVDAVQLADQRRLEHRRGRAGRQDAPLMQQHELVAEARRKIQIVRRDDDRQVALAVQPCENRANFELVGEIERGRRLVEQSRMSGLCASAPAMTTRCFSPPDSVLNRRDCEMTVPVARSARARWRDRRAFDLERAEVRIAAHRRHFEHRVLEGELRLLRNHRHAPRHRRARDRAEIDAVERDAPAEGRRARPAAEAASSCPSRSDRGCRRARRADPALTSFSSCLHRPPCATARRSATRVGRYANETLSAGRPGSRHRAPDLRRRIRCWWHVPARAREAAARKPRRR